MNELIARQVKQARQKRGWTQREVATRAGVTTGVVWKIEQGEHVLQGNLEKVAEVLGAHVESELIFGKKDPEKDELLKVLAEELRPLPMEDLGRIVRCSRALQYLPDSRLEILMEWIQRYEPKKH